MSRPPQDEVYKIYQQYFDSFEEGIKALNSQSKTLKRILQKYPDCHFVSGISEHDSKKARKINLNEGNRGRPKVGFVPKSPEYQDTYKDGLHIHAYIGGYHAATVAREFARVQNANYHRNAYGSHVNHSAVLAVKVPDNYFPLDYVIRQCTKIRSSGIKKVKAYVDEHNKSVVKHPYQNRHVKRKATKKTVY